MSFVSPDTDASLAVTIDIVPDWRRSKLEPFSKQVRLSVAELRRADRSDPDWPFTIIARRCSEGGYTVAAIHLETRRLLFEGAVEHAETREGIAGAARAVCRWLDKTGLSTKMTNTSRKRQGRKMAERMERDRIRPSP